MPAIVIDNGSGTIKVGFAGEDGPRAVFPTVDRFVKSGTRHRFSHRRANRLRLSRARLRTPGSYDVVMLVSILSLVAAFTGPPDDAPFPPISDVAVVESADSIRMFAYDREGEVAAEIVVSRVDGEITLDALFPDGLYLSVVTDGEAVNIDSDDAEEVAERLSEIEAFLQETEHQAGEVPCAAALVAGAVHAAAASPWCIVEAILAACECLPLLVEEWEDYHCPGFG